MMLVFLSLTVAIHSINENQTSNRILLNRSDDYWIEDQPYTYQPQWKRLQDGHIVFTNDSSGKNVAGYRQAVEAKTPWISKWVLSTEGRRTLKKTIPQLLLYNLVSPMDYGTSLRSTNVRRRRKKAMSMFLKDNVALPLVKSLGHVAWNLVQSHYVQYFKDELFAQRLKLMNASEMIREFNLTLPLETEQSEDDRPNTTQAYRYDGKSKRLELYAPYSAAFIPYENYSNRFYTHDEVSFTPLSLPADSYPWLWSPRLKMTRIIALQLLQSFDLDKDGVDLVDTGPTVAEKSRNLAHRDNEPPRPTDNLTILVNDSTVDDDTENMSSSMSPDEIHALEQIQMQLQEFHFDTGIPRLLVQPTESHAVFPSLAAFLQASSINKTGRTSPLTNRSIESRPAEISRFVSVSRNVSDEVSIQQQHSSDFSTRSGVYTALTHYYSYPAVDLWLPKSLGETPAECTIQQSCLVHSGVTVYTPSLTTLKLFQTFTDTSVSSSAKRNMRLEALLEMVQVAFEAERRALKHGLQGPSTVWYSVHDLDVDEFADAVLGTINMSISGETGDSKPLHVFETHMNGKVPILDEMVSYYADTDHTTKMSMAFNRSTPMLDDLHENELGVLISSLKSEMQSMEQAIVTYVHTRAVNPVYEEVVRATARGDLYNGSEYAVVGFGFVLPATNDANVLYRDMKVPVPFHLVLRLIVRFKESQLLLLHESRQLVVCLAMAVYNISFYRCRPGSFSTDNSSPDRP
ncbi:hypothetical protein PsorP6_012478 [Peronosclerospora sorghi]|uniref:Uncharacterized protein n=1 Tax=Peronosclerospora sorghi TaxID=230839 RepID=A0ACC0WFV5_9STRA|nr:hypothetical protein PsorP6_012478 [Peronosclerospora sorghi]